MAMDVELAALIEDCIVVLEQLKVRARDCADDLEHRYPTGAGPGYAYEAGIVAGWEDAATMAQGMLFTRASRRRGERERSDSAGQAQVQAKL